MSQMVEYANFGKEPIEYDSLDAINLITSLEQSGLRKEIFLYSGESPDTTYNLRQFLTEEYSREIDESITYQEFIVHDSLEAKRNSIPQEIFDQLSPEDQKIEIELERMREERDKWSPISTPKGQFHYALLKTDTSFSAYCLMRAIDFTPGITQVLLDLTNSELESWNIQTLFMVDYYLRQILFRYRRHMIQNINSR